MSLQKHLEKTDMGGYLIDTNIWSYWFDPERYPDECPNVRRRVAGLPASARLSISVISWGEIAVGLPGGLQSKQLQFVKSKHPYIHPLDTHTAEEYGRLRGLAKRPQKSKAKVDRFTWLEIGSLENDLWIIAQAMTYNLTLVTSDKFKPIRDVVGNDLKMENWAE